VKIVKFLFFVNGKVKGFGDIFGFVKIVVDVEYNEIIGVYLIGFDVIELLLVLIFV